MKKTLRLMSVDLFQEPTQRILLKRLVRTAFRYIRDNRTVERAEPLGQVVNLFFIQSMMDSTGRTSRSDEEATC